MADYVIYLDRQERITEVKSLGSYFPGEKVKVFIKSERKLIRVSYAWDDRKITTKKIRLGQQRHCHLSIRVPEAKQTPAKLTLFIRNEFREEEITIMVYVN